MTEQTKKFSALKEIISGFYLLCLFKGKEGKTVDLLGTEQINEKVLQRYSYDTVSGSYRGSAIYRADRDIKKVFSSDFTKKGVESYVICKKYDEGGYSFDFIRKMAAGFEKVPFDFPEILKSNILPFAFTEFNGKTASIKFYVEDDKNGYLLHFSDNKIKRELTPKKYLAKFHSSAYVNLTRNDLRSEFVFDKINEKGGRMLQISEKFESGGEGQEIELEGTAQSQVVFADLFAQGKMSAAYAFEDEKKNLKIKIIENKKSRFGNYTHEINVGEEFEGVRLAKTEGVPAELSVMYLGRTEHPSLVLLAETETKQRKICIFDFDAETGRFEKSKIEEIPPALNYRGIGYCDLDGSKNESLIVNYVESGEAKVCVAYKDFGNTNNSINVILGYKSENGKNLNSVIGIPGINYLIEIKDMKLKILFSQCTQSSVLGLGLPEGFVCMGLVSLLIDNFKIGNIPGEENGRSYLMANDIIPNSELILQYDEIRNDIYVTLYLNLKYAIKRLLLVTGIVLLINITVMSILTYLERKKLQEINNLRDKTGFVFMSF